MEIFYILFITIDTTNLSKNPPFHIKYYKNKKALQQCQRAGNVRLPRQDDFRNFCMSNKVEKPYQKLEEVNGLFS